MDRRAVLAAEHEVAVAVRPAERQTLLRLAPPMLTQCGYVVSGERDRAQTVLGLRQALLDAVADLDERAADREPRLVEVDIDPAQPGDLAAPHARREQQPPRREEPITADVLEE